MTARAGGPYKDCVTKDLAALLVEDGAVPVETLERALARQREAGGALDTALLELGAIDEARLTAYLGRASDLPPPPPTAWTDTDARARRLFPPRVAERHGLAPFSVDGRELSLVATYPVDLGLLDEISFMLSLHLTAHVGPEYRVRELIHRLYGGPLSPRLAALATGGPPVPALAPGAAPSPPPDAIRAPEEAGSALPEEPPPFSADASAAEDDFSSPSPETREAPQLPRLFEAGEEDPLAAALTQAVEAIELDFLGDEGGPPPEGEAAEAEHPLAEEEGEARAVEALPPERLDRSAPPHWSLEEARAALAAARHRDQVVLVALRYVRDFFEFAAVFAVTRDAVVGHDALGTEEGTRELARSVALYASDPGVFHTVLETRGQYLGPVTREPGTDAVLRGLARGAPRTVLVFPVRMRERVVCLVYADNGEAPVSPRRLGDLLMLLSTLGPALERVLRDQKKRAGGPSAPAAETWRTREPGRSPEAPAPPEPDEPAPEAPPADETPVSFAAAAIEEPAEAPVAEAPVEAPVEVPPSEEGPAMAEPEASPDDVVEVAEPAAEAPPAPAPPPSVPAVTSAPLDVDVSFDDAEEAPPAGAAASGGDGAADPPVEPGEPPVRVAPSLAALAEQALDGDVARAAEAREALARRRREPAVREATDKLRRALLSGIAVRSAPAARALGAMREVEAIPLLVQVLENADPMCAEAASWALRAITAQPLGRDPRRWLLWWKENRGRGRAEWLFGALVHPDRETRAAAAAELTSIAPASPVAYSPDLPPEDREQAARDWAGWWAISGPAL